VLINLARGELVDEAALFAHLQRSPDFTACIDAWWIEPVRHGRFAMDHDFTSLPNVIASPHNSASVSGQRHIGLQRAAENILRVLRGGTAEHIVPRGDFMM
jgi:glycerate dehydrogenase